MKTKQILMMVLLVGAVLTLSACGTNQTASSAAVGTVPTIDNINNYAATETAPAATTATNQTADVNTVPAPAADLASSTVATTTMSNRVIPGQEDLFAQYSGAIIKTNFGDITVKFYPESPITTNNFMNLAKSGFYDGTKFHRVIKDFMIQGGDPNSKDSDWSNDGLGGPGYKFNDEINNHNLVQGSLAMANSGPNTNGSQFFIVTATSTPWLDGHYNNFGYVTSGMDVALKIQDVPTNSNDHPLSDVTVNSIELIK
jgi:peptidyl-prolyl cis-trans isomerase B (cyclophilin B)